MSTEKNCTKCGQIKSLLEFAIDRTRKDGFQCWCRECQSASYYGRPRRRPQTPAKRRLARGRPLGTNRVPTRTTGTAEGVIKELLQLTLWPMTVIAQVANVHPSTVHRIAHKNDLHERYRVARSTLQATSHIHFTRRLWRELKDLYNDPKRDFTQERVREILIGCKSADIPHAITLKKRRLRALNRGKALPRNPAATNMNEGLSHAELALLALMLQSISPPPAPKREPGRRVVLHPEETP